MRQFQRHFTLEEARAWLPDLRKRLKAARAIYASLAELRADYAAVARRIRSNGHAAKLPDLSEKGAALREALQGILDAGIQVKDIETGLVDFPHLRNGEEVFLCWREDEPDIAYWHRVEDGFAGRLPLGEE